MKRERPIVVTGIDTDVGKTVIATILAEALDGYYWKPVQCGVPRDRDWVDARLSQRGRCFPEAFYLAASCSPYLAARKEGVRIEGKNLILPICPGPLIIEGVGGFLAPLNEEESWADAAAVRDARWILVHRHYLGSLNHFLLTAASMQSRKLSIEVVFNGEGDKETEEMLLKRTGIRCLGRFAWQQELASKTVQQIAKRWRAAL